MSTQLAVSLIGDEQKQLMNRHIQVLLEVGKPLEGVLVGDMLMKTNSLSVFHYCFTTLYGSYNDFIKEIQTQPGMEMSIRLH